MESLEQGLPEFPLPSSGHTQVASNGDTLQVFLADLTEADQELVVGFYLKMGGSFRTFLFRYAEIGPIECRFCDDVGPPIRSQPPYNITLQICKQYSLT